MTAWVFIIESNLYMLMFYIFYVLVLSRSTFFLFNRWYLLASLLMSLAIPFIKIEAFSNAQLGNLGAETQSLVEATVKQGPEKLVWYDLSSLSLDKLLLIIYCAVAGILLFNVLRSLWSIIRIMKGAECIRFKTYTVVKVKNEASAAFTFGTYLFCSDNTDQHVFEHEKIHILQKHYLDILFIESLALVFWYNPVIYSYRKRMRDIHEYLADDAVSSRTGLSTYAETMVSNAFNLPAYKLTNSFNTRNNLKTRLTMLNKKRSSGWAAWKYSLALPLGLSLVFVSSSAFVLKNNIAEIAADVEHQAELPVKEIIISTKDIVSMKKAELKSSEDPLRAEKRDKRERKYAGLSADTSNKKSNNEFVVTGYGSDLKGKPRMPDYPGGINAFYAYLNSSIAKIKNEDGSSPEGRVIISFTVQKDGTLENVRALRGISSSVDAEVIGAFERSPKWIPVTKDGEKVAVAYTLPVTFGKGTTPERTSSSLRALPGEVLYIIAGREVTKEEFETLKPEDIQSISVWKNEEAIKKYGPRAKHGVIEIVLKTSS